MDFTELYEVGETTVSNFLMEYYAEIGLSDSEFLLWLQIYRFYKNGNPFPELDKLADIMQKSRGEVDVLLQNLMDKKVVSIETTRSQTGELTSSMNVSKMFVKLDEFLATRRIATTNKMPLRELKERFEEAFGRMLNSIELEMLRDWVEEDGFSEAVILLALKEAVLKSIWNFRYIERILLNWKGQNLLTDKAVIQMQKQRKIQEMQRKIKKDFGD